MPRNRHTPRFYQAEAKARDWEAARQFRSDRLDEGIHAEVRSYNDKNLALVISLEELASLLAAENETMHEQHHQVAPGEERYLDSNSLSADGFLSHPNVVSGDTQLEALTKAHAVYLGATAVREHEV